VTGQTEQDLHRERAAKLLDALWNDSKVGGALRAKTRELFPEVSLPDDQFEPMVAPLREALDATTTELKALREERAAEKKAAEETKFQSDFESRIEQARDKFRLTPEGFDAMVSRMKETQNYTDADAAAAWVKSQEPPPKQAGPSWAPQKLDLFGSANTDEKFKLLHTDPQAYQDAELQEFVADPDKYVRDTFGAAYA
jgi:hypothetical protein